MTTHTDKTTPFASLKLHMTSDTHTHTHLCTGYESRTISLLRSLILGLNVKSCGLATNSVGVVCVPGCAYTVPDKDSLRGRTRGDWLRPRVRGPAVAGRAPAAICGWKSARLVCLCAAAAAAAAAWPAALPRRLVFADGALPVWRCVCGAVLRVWGLMVVVWCRDCASSPYASVHTHTHTHTHTYTHKHNRLQRLSHKA